jgi:beta-galactosidase
MVFGIGNKTIGDNPVWKKSHVERAVSLVQRDKNHACVIFWSLGNEGGRGQNLVAMADTIRKLDTSRLIILIRNVMLQIFTMKVICILQI